MNRGNKWLDPDLWSQIGMLLLPFVGFALLFFLSQPKVPDEYRGPPRKARPDQTLRVVIPESLPADALPKLASITPKGLVDVVRQMEIETVAAATSAVVSKAAETASTPTPAKETLPLPAFRVAEYIGGLVSPDGVVVDPRTGNIFIAEEEAHRIVMITTQGRKRTVVDQDTRLYVLDGTKEKRIGPIKSPEGLAMDSFGRLYVVEDRKGGRVLAIQLDRNGKVGATEVIRVPGQGADFAWEGIAVRDTGELLLTGSTAETAELGAGGMVQGALVYRDAEARWWVPIMRPFASLSGVAFSKNGQFAVYCDEITGTLGWIDLQSRYLREGASQTSFRSPESVTPLPDGRIVIAEEGGRLAVVDPEVDIVKRIAEDMGAIETVVWDEFGQRLLVSSDGKGALLEVIPDGAFSIGVDRMERATCQAEGAIRHVPEHVPEFLRPLLDMGGLSALNENFNLAFDELTRRVPMVAVDAQAELIQGSDEIVDPIVHVRFVALDPNRLKFDEPGFDFALSAVILRTKLGQTHKTLLARTVIMSGNLWVGEFKNHGTFDVPVPFAYQAQPGPRGHAVIHFTGLGRSPDISIALNPDETMESYMIVTHLGGTLEQYRLRQTKAPDGTSNLVISMPPRRPIPWLLISDAKDAPAKKDSVTL